MRDCLSPSLTRPGLSHRAHAFELKFLLTPDQAAQAEQRLLTTLSPDPHADPALNGMYEVHSLACDDPAFGVFLRESRTRNRKYRVRRYGSSNTVYLERKRSLNSKVRKHRAPAPLLDLPLIARGESDHPGHAWFFRAVQTGELRPVCRVRYLRRALFGESREGPMRVTFDHNIKASLAPKWSFDLQAEERPLLSGFVICEFKFRSALPAPLKAVITDLNLEPTGISKYRTSIRAFARELGVPCGPSVCP